MRVGGESRALLKQGGGGVKVRGESRKSLKQEGGRERVEGESHLKLIGSFSGS